MAESNEKSASQHARDDITDRLSGPGAVVVAVVLILIGQGVVVALFV